VIWSSADLIEKTVATKPATDADITDGYQWKKHNM
jgi:hypothetical protein